MKPRVILHNAVSVDGRLTGFRSIRGFTTSWPDASRRMSLSPEAGRFWKARKEKSWAGNGGDSRSPGRRSPGSPADSGRPRQSRPDQELGLFENPAVLAGCSRPVYVRSPGRADRAVPPSGHSLFPRGTDPGRSCRLAGVHRSQIRGSNGPGGRRGTFERRPPAGGPGRRDQLLVHPFCVGGHNPRTIFETEDTAALNGSLVLKLAGNETLAGGLVWLRYAVVRDKPDGPPEND